MSATLLRAFCGAQVMDVAPQRLDVAPYRRCRRCAATVGGWPQPGMRADLVARYGYTEKVHLRWRP